MADHQFQIGDLKIKGNLVLAPMDGYTDWPFRSICRKLGSAISYTEFVKAEDVLKYDDSGGLVSCNLDIKNPNSADALEHLPPEQLVADILKSEQRIIEIMEEIRAELGEAGV